jgi:hypothetical protein
MNYILAGNAQSHPDVSTAIGVLAVVLLLLVVAAVYRIIKRGGK